MLVFPHDSSRTLWVPCLEFFSRCYGRSQDLKWLLATHAWADAYERLLPPPCRPTTPERPVIKIPSFLKEADAPFLAALRHCAYAQRRVREVYSRSDETFLADPSSGVFLRAAPWFQGPADLLVEGEWLPGREVFLVHRIAGCSDPPGPPIEAVYERDQSVDVAALPPDVQTGPPLSRRHPTPDLVEMTSDLPPGRDGGHIEMRDEAFVVLGTPRRVDRRYVPRPRVNVRRPGAATPPPIFSTGDAVGQDSNVGQVYIHAPACREPSSFLLGIWQTLSALSHHAADLGSVQWYTPGRGFQSVGPPDLMLFSRSSQSSGKERAWVWLDPPRTPSRALRGLLVLRCVLAGRVGYVVEIQRRPPAKNREREMFSGLVFALHSDRLLRPWLSDLLIRLPPARGVFAGLERRCPGHAVAFPHHSKDPAHDVLTSLRGLLSPPA